VLGAKALLQIMEVIGRFAGQKDKCAGEAVADRIQRNGRFALGGLRAGAELRIGLVRRDLS
jgi:hypothetical protein